MEEEIIKAILEVTEEKKLNRKQIYEHLLAVGATKPNTEDLIYDIIQRGLDDGSIPRKRVIIYRKKSGKLPETFSPEQLISIFDNVDRPKLAIAIWLGFFCGMRVSEICKLKVEDVDLKNRKLYIRDSKNKHRSKQGYGKDRYQDIAEIAIGSIEDWLKIIRGGTWFLPSMQSPSKHLRTKTIHEQYRKLLDECGLSQAEHVTHYTAKNHGKKKKMKKTTYKYRFHTLRHTYATYLLEQGVPLENIQRALGHEQIDTTLIYAKVRDTKTKEHIDNAFSKTKSIVRNEPTRTKSNQSEDSVSKPDVSAKELLDRRLAKGEIDVIHYKNLLAAMGGED